MDWLLRPKSLNLDSNRPGAEKIWNKFYRIFKNFLTYIESEMLDNLINYVSANVYKHNWKKLLTFKGEFSFRK